MHRHEREHFPKIILQHTKVAQYHSLTMESWKPATIIGGQEEDAQHIFGVSLHRTWKTLRLPSIARADEARAATQLQVLRRKNTKASLRKVAQ